MFTPFIKATKYKKSIIIAFLGVGILALTFFASKIQPCIRLKCLSMKNLENFEVKEVYQDDKDIYRVLLSKGDALLRVDVRSNIFKAEASKRKQSQVTRLKALFENAASPYPGEISDEIECGEGYKPQLTEKDINGVRVSYFSGYLNSRLVFGVCTQDQIAYKGVLALFSCPDQKQFFQLEIIIPEEKIIDSSQYFQEMLESISCTG